MWGFKLDNPGCYEYGTATLSFMKDQEMLYLLNDCDLKIGSALYI
jgi:hypothetical protein